MKDQTGRSSFALLFVTIIPHGPLKGNGSIPNFRIALIPGFSLFDTQARWRIFSFLKNVPTAASCTVGT
jgi:hypothetical protein